MKLSLHLANKLRSQLNDKMKKIIYNKPKNFIFINLTNSLLLSKEEIEKNFNQEKEKELYNHKLFKEILFLDKELSKKIFKANVECGISDLIEEKKFIKNKIKINEDNEINQNFYENIESVNIEEKISFMKKLLEEEKSDIISRTNNLIYIKINDFYDKEKMLKELREIDEKINELNIINKIDIEISDFIKKEFGF